MIRIVEKPKPVELVTCVVCLLPTHPTRMASDADFRLIHPAYAATARPGTCSDCALGLPVGFRPL